ncbi:MAG: TIGR02587 family membrane protein [Nitrospirota bacterium]
MSTNESPQKQDRSADSRFLIDLARAFGGALFFSLPMLMTMEMWWLGFYMDRLRLALLLFLAVPVLTILSYHAGFEETFRWQEDLQDAFVALAVGFASAAGILFLLDIVTADTSLDDAIGKVGIQAIPGSIGAMLARTQLGGGKAQPRERRESHRYLGELFLMGVGAVYLALNVAPTEEMLLLSYKMSGWHTVALALVSMLLLHAFVYAVEFRGHATVPEGTPLWSVFLRFTVVGYAVALLISLYLLWTFGRLEGTAVFETIEAVFVLGFPAALGAAVARLVL